MRRALVLLALTTTLAGCVAKADRSTDKPKAANDQGIIADTSASAVAVEVFRYGYSDDNPYNNGKVVNAEGAYAQDHLEEILRTIEIADVKYADSLAVVMLRYSVGSKIFREKMYLRRYKGKWMRSADQYFHYSEYSDEGKDPFGDGKGERAKEIIEAADKWESESASVF